MTTAARMAEHGLCAFVPCNCNETGWAPIRETDGRFACVVCEKPKVTADIEWVDAAGAFDKGWAILLDEAPRAN